MLYIMRHGKTDWNAQRRLQGRTDIPLNDEGRQMARQAAAECRGTHLDICFCSPLSRARETAEILLEGRGIPIVPDDRLLEMRFGMYEGAARVMDQKGSPMARLFEHPEAYEPVPGGESMDELFARTGAFLRETAAPLLAEGKDVLIIGHGAMNSSIICQVKHLPREKFWSGGVENCQLIRLV